MATLHLKSNILELACRACLKMKKTCFNIFEHRQNDQLLADMIMDCSSIKVQKKDGFPVNICDECIEKLISACKFKTMIIQSNFKLHKCYESKKTDKEKELLNDEIIIVKQESWIKIEQSDNAAINKFIVDKEGQNSPNSPSNKRTLREKNCSVFTCKNKNIYNQQAVKNETFEKINIFNLDLYKIKPQYVSSSDNDFSDSLDSFNASSGESLTDNNNDWKAKSRNTKQNVSSTKLKKQRGNVKNHNEKQAALLDNPDYQRIINSGLRMKEKDLETVFCGECKKTFSFRYYVAIHAYTHTGNLPYKCETCDKCYPKRSLLKRHLLSHSQTRNFACDECGKAFFRKQQMQYHKAPKHSDDRPHKCTVCEKTFKIPSALWKHALIHVNDKKFVCEICGRGFLELVGLTKHKVTHTTERNFACTICGKSFLRKRGLSWHTKKHSEDKPHICSYCGRRFHCTTVLKRHILTHTGAKPFACQICGKAFRQRSCIGRHMRIHTGETPFPCKLCSLRFKYKHHLNNHMKVHGEEVS